MRAIALLPLALVPACDREFFPSQAGCLYDSPLGAFAATFTEGDPCRRDLYASGVGSMKAGRGHNLCDEVSCARPASHGSPDWVGPPGPPQRHGDAAVADLRSCAECHDGAETTCVARHHVGGVAGTKAHRSTWGIPWSTVTNEACFTCHP